MISSTAGGYAKKVCGYIRGELLHWGFNRVYTLPVIRMGAAEPTSKMKTACYKAALRLYDDTVSGKLHSPAVKQVFFYQLWRNMSKTGNTPADFNYWRDSGLVNHEFTPAVKLGICKKVFGKLMNGLLGKVMKV